MDTYIHKLRERQTEDRYTDRQPNRQTNRHKVVYPIWKSIYFPDIMPHTCIPENIPHTCRYMRG